MRERNDPGDDAKERKWLHFQMSGVSRDLRRVDCDQAVVRLVDVEKLHKAFREEVADRLNALPQFLQMFGLHLRLLMGHDHVQTHNAATIGAHVNGVMDGLNVDGDMAVQPGAATQ